MRISYLYPTYIARPLSPSLSPSPLTHLSPSSPPSCPKPRNGTTPSAHFARCLRLCISFFLLLGARLPHIPGLARIPACRALCPGHARCGTANYCVPSPVTVLYTAHKPITTHAWPPRLALGCLLLQYRTPVVRTVRGNGRAGERDAADHPQVPSERGRRSRVITNKYLGR